MTVGDPSGRDQRARLPPEGSSRLGHELGGEGQRWNRDQRLVIRPEAASRSSRIPWLSKYWRLPTPEHRGRASSAGSGRHPPGAALSGISAPRRSPTASRSSSTATRPRSGAMSPVPRRPRRLGGARSTADADGAEIGSAVVALQQGVFTLPPQGRKARTVDPRSIPHDPVWRRRGRAG